MTQSLPRWRVIQLSKSAREAGRIASLRFLQANRERTTYARPAFEHEHELDDVLGVTVVIVAQKSAHPTGRTLISQYGMRGMPELLAHVRRDQSESFARALFEIAVISAECEGNHSAFFEAGSFTVLDGSVVPLGRQTVRADQQRERMIP
jgi:hypothetical protein